jgi:glutamate N-acetyltransferase/amino-acid N-acetyltransferase
VADRDLLTIRFGDILVAEKGWVAESYSEAEGAAYMKRPELVDFGRSRPRDRRGDGLDLRPDHRYIAINADYRS